MKSLVLAFLRLCGILWCRARGAQVHRTALIHGFPRIVVKSGASILIGPKVTLNASLWSNPFNDGRRMVLFAGPDAAIRLEEASGVSASRIIAHQSIRIGRGSLIGAGCLLTDSDMHEIPLGSSNSVRVSPISIGEGVFIGANTTILKGAEIEDHAVIGASSVVTAKIPRGSIAAGNPARPIR